MMAGMKFDPDAAYQALTARDARFDGRLFVGVTSTGVYCRPICRVRTPQRRNCRFFATPAQAFIVALCALSGIGPWTAHYIAMRALGWPDAFPPRDVAVLKAMQRRFGTADQRGADARAEAWRPWRAYAVLRLWNSLETGP